MKPWVQQLGVQGRGRPRATAWPTGGLDGEEAREKGLVDQGKNLGFIQVCWRATG